MALDLRWTDPTEVDLIAQTRHRCYGSAQNQIGRFRDGVLKDGRTQPGDVLLASRGGETVGTLTSLSLNLWARGARLPTQGIAWVGTVKHSRRTGREGETGIASAMMLDALRLGRDRGQVMSALMPFRASFYEHFGFGNAERRTDWTVPMSILPRGDTSGFRFVELPKDLTGLGAARTREAREGQCDVESCPAAMQLWAEAWEDGLVFCHETGGTIDSFAYVSDDRGPVKAILKVNDWTCDSAAELLRLLCFFGTMRDQYSELHITLPGDFPLNRVLKESQIPHRQVDHPVAAARPFTRMQLRVLDHKKAVEAIHLPNGAKGRTVVAVRESEGHVSRFGLEIDSGRATVNATLATEHVECTDVVWASLISGDLPATQARKIGKLTGPATAIELLDLFSVGPAPFCQEYW